MKEIVKLDIIQEEIVDGLVVDSWGLSNELKKPGTRILTQWIEESGFPTPTQAAPQVAKFLIVRTMDKESRLVQLQEELDLTKNVLDKKGKLNCELTKSIERAKEEIKVHENSYFNLKTSYNNEVEKCRKLEKDIGKIRQELGEAKMREIVGK